MPYFTHGDDRHKLMLLYFIVHLRFSVSPDQLADLLALGDFMTYFEAKTLLADLIDVDFILLETIHNNAFCVVTEKGRTALSYFINSVPTSRIEALQAFADEQNAKWLDA